MKYQYKKTGTVVETKRKLNSADFWPIAGEKETAKKENTSAKATESEAETKETAEAAEAAETTEAEAAETAEAETTTTKTSRTQKKTASTKK